MILGSVPAREVLVNEMEVQYKRERWSPVFEKVQLSARINSITVTSQVISSSVGTTSNTQRDAAIGEEVKLVDVKLVDSEVFKVKNCRERSRFENSTVFSLLCCALIPWKITGMRTSKLG